MSGSGLIYAAIALMWGAVLIPMWLRNHDSAVESRSAERFGQAMRVLSRRERDDPDEMSGYHEEFGASDHRPENVDEPIMERGTEQITASARPPARARRPEPRQRPQRTLAQRRARTLAVLATAFLVLTLAAVVTPVPWWAPLPVAGLLVAFVVHLRVQAIQRERRRTGAKRPIPEWVGSAPAPMPKAETTQHETGSGAAPVEERAASSFVSGPSRAVVVETKGSTSDTPVTFDEDDAESWRPNPLPLPTYVTAPKAVRPIKVIDLTTPGAWTSGRLLDDDFAAEDLLAAEVASDELDALLEQEAAPAPTEQEHDEASRRAVGD